MARLTPPALGQEHATKLALVRAGLGDALLPRVGRPALPDGLVAVPLDPPMTRRINAAWRSGTGRRPAVRAVLDALASATAEAVDAAL